MAITTCSPSTTLSNFENFYAGSPQWSQRVYDRQTTSIGHVLYSSLWRISGMIKCHILPSLKIWPLFLATFFGQPQPLSSTLEFSWVIKVSQFKPQFEITRISQCYTVPRTSTRWGTPVRYAISTQATVLSGRRIDSSHCFKRDHSCIGCNFDDYYQVLTWNLRTAMAGGSTSKVGNFSS